MNRVMRQSIIRKHKLLVVIFVIVVMAIGVIVGSLYCIYASRTRTQDGAKTRQDRERMSNASITGTLDSEKTRQDGERKCQMQA